MVNKAVTSLLNDSLAELDVKIYSEQQMSIVEFCLTYTNLRGQDLINFCEDMIDQSNHSVVLTESAAAQIGQRIGHGWHTFLRGAGADRADTVNNSDGTTSPNTAGKPVANGFFNQRKDQLSNFFGTKGSGVRNGGILQVDDNDAKVTHYLIFPEIDLSRKGHSELLDKLAAAEKQSGGNKTVTPIYANNAARANIQSRATEVRLSDKFANLVKDKTAVVKALTDLSNYANQERLQLSRYAFLTPEEINDVVSGIGSKVSEIGGIPKEAVADEAKDAQAGAAAIDATDKKDPGTPTASNTFNAAYGKAATANIGPGSAPSTGNGGAVSPSAPGAASGVGGTGLGNQSQEDEVSTAPIDPATGARIGAPVPPTTEQPQASQVPAARQGIRRKLNTSDFARPAAIPTTQAPPVSQVPASAYSSSFNASTQPSSLNGQTLGSSEDGAPRQQAPAMDTTPPQKARNIRDFNGKIRP